MSHIQLDDHLYIGEGNNKKCYFHPSDHSKCVKVLKSHPEAKRKTAREVRSHEMLTKRGLKSPYIAFFLEYQKTNLGLGFVFECVDVSEETTETLAKDVLLRELQKVYDFCYKEAVVLSDLQPDNMVVRKDLSLCIVDGLGSGEFVPLCYWSKFFARRKITRKFKRVAGKLGVELKYEG